VLVRSAALEPAASYPNYCATTIEITGTEGSLFSTIRQRSNWLNTIKTGRNIRCRHAGEWVDHVYRWADGTRDDALPGMRMRDKPPMVSRKARVG